MNKLKKVETMKFLFLGKFEAVCGQLMKDTKHSYYFEVEIEEISPTVNTMFLISRQRL